MEIKPIPEKQEEEKGVVELAVGSVEEKHELDRAESLELSIEDENGYDVIEKCVEDVLMMEPHEASGSEENFPGSGSFSENFQTPRFETPVITTFSSVKKSNLKKISRYEGFSEGDSYNSRGTDEDSPTPKKRIRILLYESGDGDDSFEEKVVCAEKVVITNLSHTSLTNFGEEIVWISPPSTPLDFMFIREDYVRAERVPITRKLDASVDSYFIDGVSIGALIQSKENIAAVGFFNYEQACRKLLPTSEDFFYAQNALNLKSLDEAMNYDLTYPEDLRKNGGVFFFADIWVSSKGYREYILHKSKELEKYGVEVKGFAIQDANGSRSKTYHSGCGILFGSDKIHPQRQETVPEESVDHFKKLDKTPILLDDHCNNIFNEDCDICDITISDDFVNMIKTKTDGLGVHLLVADNPELFEVHEAVREVRYQKKLYAECIIALLAVRDGGTFVVKMFDAISIFTAGLIFLMHRCFQSMTIHKPKSSPCHTSERFLICKGKLSNETSEEILQFLLSCHSIVMNNELLKKIIKGRARRRVVVHKFEVKKLLPLKVIAGHSDFFEFLRRQNIRYTTSFTKEISEICSKILTNSL